MAQPPPVSTEKNRPGEEMPDFDQEWMCFYEAFKPELESDLAWFEGSYRLSPEDLSRKEAGLGNQGVSVRRQEARVIEKGVTGNQQVSGTGSAVQTGSTGTQGATERDMELVENDTLRVLAEWREREGIPPWEEGG